MAALLYFMHPSNGNCEPDAICGGCGAHLFDGLDKWTRRSSPLGDSGSVECAACKADRLKDEQASGFECCPVTDCHNALPKDGLVCTDCYFYLTREEFHLLVGTRSAARRHDGEHSEHLRSQFEAYLKSACRQIVERKKRGQTLPRSLPSQRLPKGGQPS